MKTEEIIGQLKERGRRPEITQRRAKILGVFSCKGGVGKTTTVSNLSAVLSEKMDGVLVVDANLSAPNLGLHLGIIDVEISIHDVLIGTAPVEKAIHVVGEKLHAIPGSLAYEGDTPLVDFKTVLEPLRKNYKLIIVDSAPGLGTETVAAIKACDDMLIVTNPEIPTIASTLRTFRAAERYRVPVMGVVLNKVRGKKYEVPISEVKNNLGWPLLMTIPDDEKVRESLTAGVPVVRHAPKSSAGRAFLELADRVFEKLKSGKS
ncbi:MAG: AAA family ATPase [Candidatus Hadarchaeota archaeon]